MQIQQNITIHGNIPALVPVHPRLVKGSQPVGLVILKQRQLILPIEFSPYTYLMAEPLAKPQIQAKRIAVREHILKVITIRILQSHVNISLQEPVLPEPIGHHHILRCYPIRKPATTVRIKHLGRYAGKAYR